jgi:beta-aspartyl-peptidase (threonine type)
MLMGGGTWPYKAFSWFAAKGGHGHFVILRASGDDNMQKELYTEVGGVASVQTLVFHSREAASDPQVLDIVRHADGIFIAGGDQSNYVNFWKGTPLNVALNQHVHTASRSAAPVRVWRSSAPTLMAQWMAAASPRRRRCAIRRARP